MSLNIEDAAEQSREAGESDLIKLDRQLYGRSLYPIGDAELAALLRQTADALEDDDGDLAYRLTEVVGEIAIRVRGEEVRNACRNNKAGGHAPLPDVIRSLSDDVIRVAAATAEIEAAGFKVVPADEPVPPELLEEAEKIPTALVALACLIHRGEQKRSYEATVSIAKQMAKLCKRMTGAKDPTGKNFEHTTDIWEIREQAYWEGVWRGRREQGKGLPSC